MKNHLVPGGNIPYNSHVFVWFLPVFDFLVYFSKHATEFVLGNLADGWNLMQTFFDEHDYQKRGLCSRFSSLMKSLTDTSSSIDESYRQYIYWILVAALYFGELKFVFAVHKINLIPFYLLREHRFYEIFIKYHYTYCIIPSMFSHENSFGSSNKTLWRRYSQAIFYSWILCRKTGPSSRYGLSRRKESNNMTFSDDADYKEWMDVLNDLNAFRSIDQNEYLKWKASISSTYFDTPQFLLPLWMDEPRLLFHWHSGQEAQKCMDTLQAIFSPVITDSCIKSVVPYELRLYILTSLWIELFSSCSCCCVDFIQ
ncbi:MAG: hypothetical protein JSS82_07810 [Bacteroidetes bacterium]|nr:hypothetical protein [Bacteroidota bacterium]